ncbi:MAG: DNA damage-inducible protein D [Butyrivibrio sp.]|uniref:DNA damage-inducible protein D n=1 Tax=Butyrivibrio sp. TaxID=28121 RepID=UPI001B00F81F|nr:DNA damage-inducible protein D [Butyrivibrio sp.]MBO6239592.1 DNA damage-inducible protein D [Butyrivibrio sp.]
MSELKGKEYKRFEDIKYIREDGSEYWSARELAPALEYTQWRNFENVIKRAMIACENSGHSIFDDFAEVSKIVEAGATSKPKKDYELSRYACYLIVQNGDPRKEVIALGQTYFAIQTYRQELADHFNQLDEDRRRLVVRGDIKQWNQLLAETAHDAGVITNEEFAIFQNAGYMGLYGGLDVDDIHKRKGLTVSQKILDFMGSTELIANLFRISQTEEKLRKDNIQGAEKATQTHYAVGREVRKAIEKIGGTMPEDLPTPEKSIQQIEKEQMERLQKKAKAGKLMLDE